MSRENNTRAMPVRIQDVLKILSSSCVYIISSEAVFILDLISRLLVTTWFILPGKIVTYLRVTVILWDVLTTQVHICA